MRFSKSLTFIPIFLLTLGCASRLQIPVSKELNQDPTELWAKILQEYVNETGQIDFIRLKKDPSDLETYVAYATQVNPRTQPEKFPTREEQLAAYMNLYNSVAMYNAITSKYKPKNIIRFFILTKFELGDEKISLFKLENKVIRPLNEPRIHFVLNCMVKGCPRLEREPSRPDIIEQQFDDAAKLFFSEPRNLTVDKENKEVYFSKILKFYTKDFLIEHPSLIAYANQYRDEKIPDDYKIKFFPYDWSLNQS